MLFTRVRGCRSSRKGICGPALSILANARGKLSLDATVAVPLQCFGFFGPQKQLLAPIGKCREIKLAVHPLAGGRGYTRDVFCRQKSGARRKAPPPCRSGEEDANPRSKFAGDR